MTVVLEAPLTTSGPHDNHLDTPLLFAPRYMRSRLMGRWHRPRAGVIHGRTGHTAYRLWCGASVFPVNGHITADSVPDGEPVCGTCEGRSIGAGQDDWPVPGKVLLFEPHRLVPPKQCPGQQREDLYEEVSRRVVRCLACGDVVPGKYYGCNPYEGAKGWGPARHAPGPELVTGCPFHAWRYLVRRDVVVACSCRFADEEASAPRADRTDCTRCHGTGKEPRKPSRDQVVTWMAVTGWVPGAAGSAGAWWTLPGTDHVIGVANSFPGPDSIEYRSVIERLAVFAMCSPDDLGERIADWSGAGES